MTGKERAAFRSEANTLKPIFQLGKEGVSENLLSGVDEALQKRELIKITVLETCALSAREAANQIAPLVGAEIIQCIGRKFVLYRERKEEEPEA